MDGVVKAGMVGIVRAKTFPCCPGFALQPFRPPEKHSKRALEPVSQLFDETQKQGWLQDNWEKEPEYRPEKVRQVVDVVTAAPRRIRTVPQVNHPENKAGYRNRDKKHHDPDGGVEQNAGKQHGRHRTRGADAGKSGIVPVFLKSR